MFTGIGGFSLGLKRAETQTFSFWKAFSWRQRNGFLFAEAFADPNADPMFDLDGDGEVDFPDFFLFGDAFGREGRAKLYALAEELLGLPSVTSLQQNYPNPFNAETTITYQVSRPGLVIIEVYDLSGQLVKTLADYHHDSGHYRVHWDGKNSAGGRASSGVYLVRLWTAHYVDNRKITLLK